MPTAETMRAAQLQEPGPPSNLKLIELPIPVPKEGEVLIKVKAFGLNRSEILTRKFGKAPIGAVQLPLVLGLEAAGVVEAAPGHEKEFPRGSIVLTALWGMGFAFNGSYAQYVCVPKAGVQLLKSGAEKLGWEILGALPLMLQTAHGCLFRCLKLKAGETILIRGGTTSIGLAAAVLAKKAGATVLASTRKADEKTAKLLLDNGADHVIVDDGSDKSESVRKLYPAGVNKVLELVGGTTTLDSLACLAQDGVCCLVGLVGGSPFVPNFNPLSMLRMERYLTAYAERTFSSNNVPLSELIGQIEEGSLKVPIGRVFHLDQIVEAHECMEKNEGNGKIVILTGM
jgi:NADPH:quinone reductase-like Zn-dependent oxidoreductase